MAVITQTNRTILFEKFTEGENGDRLDLILNTDEESRDIRFSNVIEKLICHSYEEFLEKFTPVYYNTIRSKEVMGVGQIPVYDYSLNKLENPNATAHKLCEQPFFKAMEKLYTTKGKSLENDLALNFNSITEEAYSPSTAMKNVLDIRRELKYHMEQYLQLEQQNGSIHDKNIHARAVKKLRKHIKEEYIDNNSKFNAIPLLIRQTELEVEYRQKNENNSDSQITSVQNRQMDYYIDDKGELKVTYKEIPTQDMILIETSAENLPETKIYEILSKDFDNHPTNQNANESSSKFMRDMHLAMFSENKNSLRALSDAQLENNLEKYRFIYKESNENFSKNILPLVEKVINVKAFFDHAGEGSELIIANCTVEELMKDETHRKRFEFFIKDAGNQADDNRIWLSIIPAVFHKDIVKLALPEKLVNWDDDSDDDNTYDIKNLGLVQFETLIQALDILNKYHIITFFNFKGCKNTSQRGLTKKIVEEYKNKIFANISRQKSSAYAVFCYPNFTLLPERNTTVQFSKEHTLQLPAVYLDASYIACGLTVSVQKCDTLREKGFEVNKNLCPPVRFDFEGSFLQGDNMVALRHIFPTKLNRESLLSWDSDLQKEIAKDGGFGFCFCCDASGYVDRGMALQQEHAYVYRARTLHKRVKSLPNGKAEEYYYPLFSAFTKTYVTNYYNLTKDISIAKQKCGQWNIPLAVKKYINNLVYSPKYSSVKTEEKISISMDNNELKYKIEHDNNSEDVKVIVED